MAYKYFRNASGKYIKRDDEYMRAEECCCEPPCDCETDGPVADFSYEQTDDDPCLFDFTDDSTPGACGAIVGWQWFANGIPFSTDQNPTGIDLEDVTGSPGPWDITLTVTDENDCTDTALLEELECGLRCGNCIVDDFLPGFLTITFPTLPNVSRCGCAWISGGTFVLPWNGPGAGDCQSYNLTINDCSPDTLTISVNHNSSATQVTVSGSNLGGVPITWNATRATSSCRGTFSVPGVTTFPSSAGCGVVFGTAGNVTVVV